MSELRMRGSLAWAIRDSFVRYVTVIAGGSISLDDVETDADGRFVFPLIAATQRDEDWHLSFGGAVRFTAHHGFLDVIVEAPEVLIGPNGGVLGTFTEDEDLPLLPLVEISATPIDDEDTSALRDEELNTRWDSLPTQLLSAGSTHFGNVYKEGEPMAPISLRVTALDS
ncbi:MAG: HtaA domain-containing protein [Gulosibacter sp.]|uniref:HtaA domain-containing protein n=1 Tax=Gulosibacter sp. TaxID=2817531 RepID=UPI003F927BB2